MGGISLGWQAAQGSLDLPTGLREPDRWVGEGKLTYMVQKSDGGGNTAGQWSGPISFRYILKYAKVFCFYQSVVLNNFIL